jgi:ABC-type branched-subunit amino acid transport system substrate-binding protein
MVSCASFGRKEKLNTAPEPVKVQLNTALQQFQNNQLSQCIKTLNGILKFHRNTDTGDDALFLLAKTYSRQENWEKALGAYRSLYDSQYYSGREAASRVAAAKILTYKIGDYKQALQLVDASFRTRLDREQRADLLEVRFTSLMRTGSQLEAFETLVTLSEQHPVASKRESFKQKAKSFLDSRLTGPDLKDFADDSAESDLKVDAMYRYGVFLMGEGNYSEARSYFESVIAMRPKSYVSTQAQQLIEQLSARDKVNQRTIGVILPLSDRYESIGYQALWGLQLALGIKGGRNSENVRLAVIDSRGNPSQARKAVKRLVEEDHAIAIVGGLLGKTAYAASIQAQELGVPFLALSQKEGLTDIGPFIFRNALTVESQLDQLITTAMDKMEFKKFAILYPNDPYGVKISNVFWKKVQERGGIITGAQSYLPGETDFNEHIQKLVGTFYISDRQDEYSKRLKEWYEKQPKGSRQRKKPPIGLLPPIVDFDAIFIPDGPKAIGQIAPMLAYNDVNDVYLIGTNIWNTNEFLRRGQNFVSKSLFTDGFYGKAESFLSSRFYKAYAENFNKAPSTFSLLGYDSGLVVRSVLSQGAGNRLDFAKEILQNKGIPGALNTLVLNNKKEFVRPVVTLTVQEGEIIPFEHKEL